MTAKKPFTEEQEERIKIIVRKAADDGIETHIRWSIAHKETLGLLVLASIIISSVLSTVTYAEFHKHINQQSLTPDDIGRMMGWEKVCVETVYIPSDYPAYERCVVECNYPSDLGWVRGVIWCATECIKETSDKNCTRYTWLPPERPEASQ